MVKTDLYFNHLEKEDVLNSKLIKNYSNSFNINRSIGTVLNHKANKDLYKDLDKYYTKETVAIQCISTVKTLLVKAGYDLSKLMFIEPSAGSGAFLNNFPKKQSIGFDILPTADHIIQSNFLTDNLELTDLENNVIIGNPPFGKKGVMALDFINKALSVSNIVCFILPIQFRKYNLQKNINTGARLILDELLPENSFEFMESDYKLRSCFQIWINGNNTNFNDLPDLRIKNKPAITHPDFEMFQYNSTEQALKYFDYEWNFAVLRQGWGDFNQIYYSRDKEKMNKKKQYIFFKAKNKEVLTKLLNINFNSVAELNTSVKGFGKADIVKHYNEIY